MVDEQEIKKCKRGKRGEVTRGPRGQVVTHKFITFPVTWSYFMPKTNRLARRDEREVPGNDENEYLSCFVAFLRPRDILVDR